jgi:hypothetical protein
VTDEREVESTDPLRGSRFTYLGFEVDEPAQTLSCRYELDDLTFVETFTFPSGGRWSPEAYEAARFVFLFAAVSYFKATAPAEIDLAETSLRRGDRELLNEYYLDGLGEFAYRNGISLEATKFVGGVDVSGTVPTQLPSGRPMVPFGGGIDSLVSVDVVTDVHDDVALFVVHRAGDPFDAIEQAAKATGLPVLRVEREVDDQILRPSDPDRFLNGHVPITGILSAVAVLTAVLHGRDTVVMSNEWSASRGNLVHNGRLVNHQYSKSESFERGFRTALAAALEPPVDYFSLLRARSELWVAQRFAGLEHFHPVVHSCNRAFHLARGERQEQWCGECEKCCFIDLILSPFMQRAQLEAIFGDREPLANPELLPTFRDLIGTSDGRKPFECVGDVDECRSAAVLALERSDRAGNAVLRTLVSELSATDVDAARAQVPRLLSPMGPHWVPDELLESAALV